MWNATWVLFCLQFQLSSNYHIEVNPSDVGIQDRVVIQELLKGIAQTHNVAVQAQRDKEEKRKSFKGSHFTNDILLWQSTVSLDRRSTDLLMNSSLKHWSSVDVFFSSFSCFWRIFLMYNLRLFCCMSHLYSTVVILTEVERLSKEAQHALRRTMEKYMASCRLILMCNSTTKVIPAIRSRCLGLRVPAPSKDEIVSKPVITHISKISTKTNKSLANTNCAR